MSIRLEHRFERTPFDLFLRGYVRMHTAFRSSPLPNGGIVYHKTRDLPYVLALLAPSPVVAYDQRVSIDRAGESLRASSAVPVGSMRFVVLVTYASRAGGIDVVSDVKLEGVPPLLETLLRPLVAAEGAKQRKLEHEAMAAAYSPPSSTA